jgi:hypothetical protein
MGVEQQQAKGDEELCGPSGSQQFSSLNIFQLPLSLARERVTAVFKFK